MKKLILLLFIILLTACGQQEAPGLIYGKVNLIGSSNLSGIVVNMPGINAEVETDEKGNFVIYDVPVGTWSVIARKAGYTEQVRRVIIQSNDIVFDVNFQLLKLTPPDLPNRFLD